MKQRILFNASIILVTRIIAAIISFLLVPFMLTYLGTEPYGILSLAISFSATSGFTALFDFGMRPALIVYVARYLVEKNYSLLSNLISTAIILYTILGILSGSILFFLSNWLITDAFKLSPSLIPVSRLIFQIMAVQVVIEFIRSVPLSVLEGDQNYKITQGIVTFIGLGRALATVVIILLGYGVLGVALAYFSEALIISSLMTWLMFRQFPELSINLKYDRHLMHDLLGLSKPIFGQQITGLIFRQTDRFIVGSFLSVALVAHYNIIQGLYRTVMIFQSFSPVILPAASQATIQKDLNQLRSMFIHNTKYATALTSMVAIIAAILMQPLLLKWVGMDYVYLKQLAQVYVLMAILTSFIGVGQTMLIPLGRAKEVMVIGLISSLISFFGSLVTVTRWQLSGIVWTTVLGAIVGFVFTLWLILRELKIDLRDLIVPLFVRSFFSIIAVGFLLMAAIQIQMPANFIEVVIYGAIAVLTNAILFYYMGLDNDEQIRLQYKIRQLSNKIV